MEIRQGRQRERLSEKENGNESKMGGNNGVGVFRRATVKV